MPPVSHSPVNYSRAGKLKRFDTVNIIWKLIGWKKSEHKGLLLILVIINKVKIMY